MGDKSPKANDKRKKQGDADKKKAADKKQPAPAADKKK
jgi:hypothetical protein